MKLSSIARRLLDRNVRVLFKAGYIGDDLSITKKGMNRLLAKLMQDNLEPFVKEAEEEIKEMEEDKKAGISDCDREE